HFLRPTASFRAGPKCLEPDGFFNSGGLCCKIAMQGSALSGTTPAVEQLPLKDNRDLFLLVIVILIVTYPSTTYARSQNNAEKEALVARRTLHVSNSHGAASRPAQRVRHL